MIRDVPPFVRQDVASAVLRAAEVRGVVEVSVLAETLRLRHEPENIALEDIEAIVVSEAERHHCAMEFGGRGDAIPGGDISSGCLKATAEVALFANANGFVVRVIENGDSQDREFELDAFARSYAEGQRLRLGLRSYFTAPDSRDE